MIKLYTSVLSIPNGQATELAMDTQVVPDGHTWKLQEIDFTCLTKCILYLYWQNERVITINNLARTDTQRIVLNWELKGGEVLRLTGTNSDSSAHICGMQLITDDLSA